MYFKMDWVSVLVIHFIAYLNQCITGLYLCIGYSMSGVLSFDEIDMLN